ncbi:MAG: hypothetical protein JWM68_1890 [Verrucomicrobiales bacterium]|nr:hypothetical protein [Verrucomicrobiales bacterium]
MGKDEVPEPDETTEATLDQARAVGVLAQRRYATGVDVTGGGAVHGPALAQTQALLRCRVPLFEPDFVYNCCYARADILEPVDADAWDIIEVKGSTKVKDEHLHDIAFQRFVYEGAGIKIRRCFVLHVNNKYVLQGDIDPQQMFTKVDVTSSVDELMSTIAPNLTRISNAIGLAAHPVIQVGSHCEKPNTCPIYDRCWSTLPEDNVFTLTYGGKKSQKLFSSGVQHIKDIPADFDLSDKQQIQKQAVISGKAHVDKAAIQGFLDSLEYPLHFLDFETYGHQLML